MTDSLDSQQHQEELQEEDGRYLEDVFDIFLPGSSPQSNFGVLLADQATMVQFDRYFTKWRYQPHHTHILPGRCTDNSWML